METLGADVDFLSKLNIIGYSLLLGIRHGPGRRGRLLDAQADEEDDEEYDSAGSGGVALTPPETPTLDGRSPSLMVSQASRIDPNLDIYAIPYGRRGRRRGQSQVQSTFIHLIMDVLTHYGIKKAAAKAAKTVKYGSDVEGNLHCGARASTVGGSSPFVNDAIE